MTEEQQNTEERRALQIPDRRKHTYDQLQAHLDECIDSIESYIHKWIRRGLISFSIIAAFCVIALVGFGYVLQEVQRQRHEVCQAQNGRHDQTVKLFKKAAVDAIKKHPDQAKDIRENIDTNLQIINALAPKQDCDRIAPERNLLP